MLKEFLLKPFTINFEDHLLHGTTTCSDQIPKLLFLHGAGQSNQDRFTLIRKDLIELGISSVSFDFIGHGKTGGSLEESSLQQRFNQASDIIKVLNLSPSLSIVASSMSAYIAIKLLKKHPIENLILFVPAIYNTKAYTIPFNQGFSEIIRMPNSWLDSDAWDILQNFKGNLLIISAANDEIIPPAIVQKLYDSAKDAKKRELLIIENCSHQILKYLSDKPFKHKEIAKKIFDLIISK